MLANRTLQAANNSGYQIQRSLRTRGAYPTTPTYLNRTFTTPTNNLRWTWSAWVKRGQLGVAQHLFNSSADGSSTYEDYIVILASDRLAFYQTNGSVTAVSTNTLLRDPSAWYHIVVVYDSAQGTAANRVAMYINGVAQTFSATTYPTASLASTLNSARLHRVSSRTYAVDEGFDGYWAEINFIDGQALTPSSFGQTDLVTGAWSAKRYAGTYGNNGFYLDFRDPTNTTTLCADRSGNGNNWTATGISLTGDAFHDSMLDVPLGGGGGERGNYAVLNRLDIGSSAVVGDCGLRFDTTGSAYRTVKATITPGAGAFYFELGAGGGSAGDNCRVGLCSASENIQTGILGQSSTSYMYSSNGNQGNNSIGTGVGATWGPGDKIGVSCDGVTITYYKNGVIQGTQTIVGGWKDLTFAVTSYYDTEYVNFGQRPFAYTPPTGFKALHTGNLIAPTIQKPNQYFDITTYTGNGSTQSIINSALMLPDLVWLKGRSGTENHQLFDSVRGINKALYSNLNNQEATDPGVSAFNTNGFTLGGTSNTNTASYVAWQWKKGSIPGFDIVTYTGNGVSGRTIAHSLGSIPKLIITKPTNSPGFDWAVYHVSTTATGYLLLNQTTAFTTSSVPWNNTAPTSSVFTLGNGGSTNPNGVAVVAYLFAEVAGFSKIGGYVGNGSVDGPFIYCGFRPKFVMLKRSETTSDWYIHDATRDTYNYTIKNLYPNSSAAENTTELESTYGIDFLSNGFKIRASHATRNTASGSYIFIAFAEAPFKNALAR